MREMRMLLFTEDYCGSILVLTNLDNRQLEQVLIQCDEDVENGVGRTTEEIAESLFSNEKDMYYKELGSTYEGDFNYLNDINSEYVADYTCFTFTAIQSKQ